VKRWPAREFGAPDTVLEKAEVALPEPGPNEARVRVLAVSTHFPTWWREVRCLGPGPG
jgi:NADPH:quinone reductase-like Zn-dependent oxidoreductase